MSRGGIRRWMLRMELPSGHEWRKIREVICGVKEDMLVGVTEEHFIPGLSRLHPEDLPQSGQEFTHANSHTRTRLWRSRREIGSDTNVHNTHASSHLVWNRSASAAAPRCLHLRSCQRFGCHCVNILLFWCCVIYRFTPLTTLCVVRCLPQVLLPSLSKWHHTFWHDMS